ncbi:hypothetical protein NM688_g7679 [Phlebia brevispora]|uniref:Uncharacterized protein n=1 Tax=Phlebia brevispora TaxID=194682 RepID=A0ACC1S2D5_9APHY|nr:hypothetical protein NM688_g7679 [Phlebia brevispora]
MIRNIQVVDYDQFLYGAYRTSSRLRGILVFPDEYSEISESMPVAYNISWNLTRDLAVLQTILSNAALFHPYLDRFLQDDSSMDTSHSLSAQQSPTPSRPRGSPMTSMFQLPTSEFLDREQSSVKLTPQKKCTLAVAKRIDALLLAFVDDCIKLDELPAIITRLPAGSRLKIKDAAFCLLFRGYRRASSIAYLKTVLADLTARPQPSISDIQTTSLEVDAMTAPGARLFERHNHVASLEATFDTFSWLLHVLKHVEVLKFAIEWSDLCRHGSQMIKTQFYNSLFAATPNGQELLTPPGGTNTLSPSLQAAIAISLSITYQNVGDSKSGGAVHWSAGRPTPRWSSTGLSCYSRPRFPLFLIVHILLQAVHPCLVAASRFTHHLVQHRVLLKHRPCPPLTAHSKRSGSQREVFRLPDPFAVITVDAEQTHTTSVIKKTLNPYWNESFDIMVKESSVIAVQIFDQRKFKKRDQGFLGVVNIRVGDHLDLELGGHGASFHLSSVRSR